ncbi:MAG TPA: histidinol-phosphatase [Thermoanaerobaculia bacterium]|nr:histidinol-phosphatase [Thermoanaerobaculia bacterium]
MQLPDLRLALELAEAADEITMKHFRTASLEVRTKSDKTPVSEADEAVERMIRERLARERPDDGIVGEEYGASGSALTAGGRRWIIDPIDATKNYVRGVPVFATLIALEDNGTIAAGVVSAPALGRCWSASRGSGAFCNGLAIRASNVATLEYASIGYDSVTDFDRTGNAEQFLALVRHCGRARGLGDFWIHMLVAEGAVDIAVEPTVAPWDVAAVQVIVEEAGGRFTDLAGNARHDGGSALSTNGALHETVLEMLR